MSVYSDLRDAVEARINTVSNIGIVHDKIRYSNRWSDFLAQFKTSIGGVTQIRGWWVTWEGIPSSGDSARFSSVSENYIFIVRGVLNVDDATESEKTFYELVTSVKDAIRNRIDFGSTAVVDYSPVVTVPVLEHRWFGNVLCHFCEIHVAIEAVESITWA